MAEDRYTTVGHTTTAELEHEAKEEAKHDPITGEPGAHPLGTGVGAVGGGAAGAAIGGAVGGPVGAMIGAAVGGVAGGLAGKGVAESVNPTEEEAYWREAHASRPYAAKRTYDELAPAYRYGWESCVRYGGCEWNAAEPELERGWDKAKADSKLGWNEAKGATRDAWDRVSDRVRQARESTGEHEHRHRTANLATPALDLYEKVSSITGFGLSPGLGATTPSITSVETAPGITGLDLDIAPGEPGTIHDPLFTDEDDHYWRENYASRPYARSGSNYDEYRPAYQYGTTAAHRFKGRRWEDVESDLERGWNEARGDSGSAWHHSKEAVRDAWHRVERALPGDADHDGR